jgi:3-oxoacyl-[acyl-carrier protein] reductase
MINTGLSDKVVVVTGANNPHGIGAAIAKAFAAQGSRLFLHYFRDKSSAANSDSVASPGEAFYRTQQAKCIDEVVDTIRALGAQTCAWEADFSNTTPAGDLFDEAEKTLGSVSVLVNNAAYWEGDTFLTADAKLANELHILWTDRPKQISVGSLGRLFNVNTFAPALLMAEFVRRHIERRAAWGRIVNISTDGASCFPSEISYAASKSALESYSKSAAVELGPLGITVNEVSLGPVQTGWITPELEKQVLPTIPLARIGSPEEVADVVVFLASEQARWVTGQTIYVGGGHRV